MSEKAKSTAHGEKKFGKVYYLKTSKGLFPLSGGKVSFREGAEAAAIRCEWASCAAGELLIL